MKKLLFAMLIVSALVIPSQVIAGEASNCVKVSNADIESYEDPRQQISNTCGEKIHVVYCHNGSSKPGTDKTKCGSKGKYWQQQEVLDPGESYDNQYSLPADARISYSACAGGYGSAYTDGKKDGTIYCK